MIALDENNRVVILTNDTLDNFTNVPKAMVRVLYLSMEAEQIDRNDKQEIMTYLLHLESILPCNFGSIEKLDSIRADLKAKKISFYDGQAKAKKVSENP
jgi:hypothetical protein